MNLNLDKRYTTQKFELSFPKAYTTREVRDMIARRIRDKRKLRRQINQDLGFKAMTADKHCTIWAHGYSDALDDVINYKLDLTNSIYKEQ